MASTPQVMISSTFYDLTQVRADLRDFLQDDLGYTPILSELPSFPVNPDADTVENCREKVRELADMLVLVVGGRYGSIDLESDKSITNIEYETARQKGIPIYVFVHRNVLSVLPTWRANPNADFSATVDTTRLFEFVENIGDAEGIWTFPFETAQDIIGTLRHQLAHLFIDSLRLRLRLASGGELPPHIRSLQAEALKIALEKPTGWEYLLYLQTWIDEVGQRVDLLRKYEAEIALGASEQVPAAEAPAWLKTRLHELENIVDAATHLLNVSAPSAFGEPGVEGDAERIVWTTATIGELFEQALKWSERIRCAKVEEPFDDPVREMARFPTQMIEQLQEFPRLALKKTREAIANVSEQSPQRVELTLTLELSNQEAFQRAFRAARQRFGG